MKARWLIIIGAFVAMAFASSSRAYWDDGQHWPAGAVIPMHLQQASAGGLLFDGVPDWDSVTERALNLWNASLNGVSFQPVRDPNPASALQDDVNNVVWGDDVYGDPFGDGVLAITISLYRPSDNIKVEADVIFNRKITWNSYRGALRAAAGGGTTYDLQRVALHEFGHVLGLNHPDDHGQTVAAVMNSHTSNIDALQADDISGVTAIYKGPPDTLQGGARLLPGQALTSGNGQFRLVYQGDGNLVLFDDAAHVPVWSTGSGDTGALQALMQADGNFVLFDATGAPRWTTGTGSNANARIVLQSDGNLVIFSAAGQPLWDRITAAPQ